MNRPTRLMHLFTAIVLISISLNVGADPIVYKGAKLKWKYMINGGERAIEVPVFDKKYVCVVVRRMGRLGGWANAPMIAIYLLDAETGTLLWEKSFEGASLGAVIIVKDILYFSLLDVRKKKNRIFAFDIKKKKILWECVVEGRLLAIPGGVQHPVLRGVDKDEYRLYFYGARGIYAVDKETGICIWKFEGMKCTFARVLNSHLIAFDDKWLFFIDTEKGLVRWGQKIDKLEQKDCVDDCSNILKISSGNMSLRNDIYVLDRSLRKVQYYYRISSRKWRDLSVVANGKLVFIASSEGYLKEVDIKTGKQVWKNWTGFSARYRPRPCLVDDLLIYPSWQKYLCAVDQDTGELKWMQPTDDFLRHLKVSDNLLIGYSVSVSEKRDSMGDKEMDYTLYVYDMNIFDRTKIPYLSIPRRYEDVKCSKKIPDGMVYIPAGKFIMGNARLQSFGYSGNREVYLDAYFIDRYEVTNEQYKKFMDETGYKPPAFWKDSRFNKPRQPVVGVTWNDTLTYATWAGKRLPTEAEWEKAARGIDGRRWAWGNFFDPGYANLSNDKEFIPSEVGAHPNDISPYGCYDMTGNVMELCQDRYERYDYRNWDRLFRKEYLFNPKGPRKEQHGGYSHRVIKSKKVGASGGLFSRRDLDPALAKNYVSFRCAKSLSQKDSKLEKHVGQQ